MKTLSSPLSRRFFAFFGTAAAVAAALPTPAGAQSRSDRNKVVFQVTEADPSKWNLVLNNVRNLQTDVADEGSEIEVVVYVPGIGMLKSDSAVAARVAETIKAGVKIVACQNTMKGMKLTPADMLPEIGYVPAGVVEVMRKQQQGYAYIRS